MNTSGQIKSLPLKSSRSLPPVASKAAQDLAPGHPLLHLLSTNYPFPPPSPGALALLLFLEHAKASVLAFSSVWNALLPYMPARLSPSCLRQRAPPPLLTQAD